MSVVEAIIQGKGATAKNAEEIIQNAYDRGIEDENIEPAVIADAQNQPVGLLGENDALIFWNFRPDRGRQLAEIFMQIEKLCFITMTQYQEDYKIRVAFPPQYITEPLAKTVSDAGRKQLHIAEAEKYAHITYFLNGGRETPFPDENRIVVPSKTGLTYDKQPAMSASEIADRVLENLEAYDFIAVNLANGDMVAHTGVLEAGIKAVETLDACIGKIKERVLALGGTLVITADHGNCEEMINLETGQTDTGHSTNPVPLWIISPNNRQDFGLPEKIEIPVTGILADVAPTVLEIMDIPQTKEMTGKSLLNKIGRLPI